ncbi:MAG: Na/Pi cotransporter family protein [Wujia sp.]
MSLIEVFSLLGGVGLFLYGMSIMSTGLKNACGNNLQNILEQATKNRFIAIVAGLLVTILIQSSSATDVMVIGFVNSGLMSLQQAVGVIMGANIGTTITAQITAFKLSSYTPLVLFIGAVMYLFMNKPFVKHVGSIIMGFGMLFTGITLIKQSIAPLSESQGFIDFISTLSAPWLAVLFGIGFTALVQSSSSSIVIFQAFAIQGLLDYKTAVYLVIGAAIGSVTPNLLAALTANRNGKRTAILNLLFNLFRAALLIILINVFPIITDTIQKLSPDNIGRQIANTHTIFAIIAVLVAAPFAGYIVKLSEKVIPVKPEESKEKEDRTLIYMTQLTRVPANVALNQTQREITRMGRIAAENLERSIDCFFHYDEDKIVAVHSNEETVNILNHAIADAMVQLRTLDLSQENMRRVSMMTIAVTDIERISDHAENIVEYIEKMHSTRAELSAPAIEELKAMSADTIEATYLALEIFESENYSKLEHMEQLEQQVDDYEQTLIHNHIERLMQANCNPLSGVIFSDIVTDLERCSDHAINLAYALKERPEKLK